MNDTDAARGSLEQAIADAGAAPADAERAAEIIANLARDYAAWFGHSDTDEIAMPLHQGMLHWRRQLEDLAVNIRKASVDTVLGADVKVDPPSIALRALLARMEQTAPRAWSQFTTGLKTIYAELEAQTANKPRRSHDRATMFFFEEAALAWRDSVGDWPPVTKRNKGDDSDTTFVDSRLLAALRLLVGTPAASALSDDKFERAIRRARRKHN